MDYEKIIKAFPLAMLQLKEAFTHTQHLKCPSVIIFSKFLVPSDDRNLQDFFDLYDIQIVLMPTFHKRQNLFVPCVSFLNDTNYLLVYKDSCNWSKTHYTEFRADNYVGAEYTKDEAEERALEKCFELLEAKLTNRLNDYTN
jgi:hypothetical protein